MTPHHCRPRVLLTSGLICAGFLNSSRVHAIVKPRSIDAAGLYSISWHVVRSGEAQETKASLVSESFYEEWRLESKKNNLHGPVYYLRAPRTSLGVQMVDQRGQHLIDSMGPKILFLKIPSASLLTLMGLNPHAQIRSDLSGRSETPETEIQIQLPGSRGEVVDSSFLIQGEDEATQIALHLQIQKKESHFSAGSVASGKKPKPSRAAVRRR